MNLSMCMVHIYIRSGTQTHTTSMHTRWFGKCLTQRALEDPWGQAFVEPLGVYAGVHGMYPCMCLCRCVCTNGYVVYTYGAHMILSMSMVHIYICSGTQTHTTSMHTKWFDKCLTPRAVEDLWGQAFVEPLGVYAGVHGMYPCMRLCI